MASSSKKSRPKPSPSTVTPVIHQAEMTSLNDLAPADWNPRVIDEASSNGLEESLDEFGLVENLIANRRTGTLVGGHQRLTSLVKLFNGDMSTKIPVVWVDLDDSMEKALNLRMNNHAGKFDMSAVRSILKTLDDSGVKGILSKTGFGKSSISEILDEMHDIKPLSAPTPEKVSALEGIPERFELGKVMTTSGHTIACLDSTDHDAVAEIVGDGQAQVVFMDLPYMANYSRGGSAQNKWKGDSVGGEREDRRELREIMNDDMNEASWNDLAAGFLATAKRILKPNGTIFFCIGPPSVEPALAAWRAAKMHRSAMIVWDKKWVGTGRQDFRPQYEFIFYGWPEKHTHRAGRYRNESDVWSIKRDPAKDYLHSSQKPVSLYSRVVRNMTLRNEVVVDLCCGSGGMILAANEMGRKCFAFDLDPRCCDTAFERMERGRLDGES